MGLAGSLEARTLELVGEDIPVGKVELELFLPPEYRYLGFGGNLLESGRASTTIWTSYERLFDGLFGSSKPEYGRSIPSSRQAGSIDIDLPTDGLVVRRFDTLAPRGTIGFWFLGSKTYAFLQVLLLVVAVAGTHRLLSRHPGCERAWQGAILAVALPFLAQAFLGGAAGEFLAAASLGAFAGVVGHGGRRVAGRVRDSRESAKGGDPYLDVAPQKKSASDIPPTVRKPEADDVPPTVRAPENEEGS